MGKLMGQRAGHGRVSVRAIVLREQVRRRPCYLSASSRLVVSVRHYIYGCVLSWLSSISSFLFCKDLPAERRWRCDAIAARASLRSYTWISRCLNTLRRADQREIRESVAFIEKTSFWPSFSRASFFWPLASSSIAADLAAFFTVRTARETTDFFFALLAIVISRLSIWIF